MICVMVLGAGAAWEASALALLDPEADVVVLRRCVDVADLLAAAGTGQAQVAVVGLDAPGVDARAVEELHRQGVEVLAVTGDPTDDDSLVRASRSGIEVLLGEANLADLAECVRDLALDAGAAPVSPGQSGEERPPPTGVGTRRTVAVWGPHGAPGRTTVAAGLAAVAAGQGRRCLLVDADPWAPSVAQHLGMLEESSGLLAATRLAPGSRLDDRFPSCCRRVAENLDVLTGLPRPDRWGEVRADALSAVLAVASRGADVVLDTGASLEEDPYGRGGRNALTLESLRRADEVLVVGTADPVGLTRLARGLVDLREAGAPGGVRVVVNRMRPGLGWSRPEVAAMVQGFVEPLGVHFLPADVATADRAALVGRSVVEVGGSALAQAVREVAASVWSTPPPGTTRPRTPIGVRGRGRDLLRRRRAGTGLRT